MSITDYIGNHPDKSLLVLIFIVVIIALLGYSNGTRRIKVAEVIVLIFLFIIVWRGAY